MKRYVPLFLVFLTLNLTYAQNCKVLLKTINETYNGDCKKGKADGEGTAKGVDTYQGQFKKGWPHGKGTYTWRDGKTFTGEFKNGKKDGQGKLTFKADSIITGFWKKDLYIGLFEKPYKTSNKSQNISGINLRKTQNDLNNLRFYLRIDQAYEKYPQLNFVLISGQYQDVINNNDFTELTNVTFPVKLKVLYKQEYFEVEIFRPGLWEITTNITYIKGLNTNN
ncbi:hypothetical protein [Seonamhaeicola sp.]|uniref:hypothetical protein n=1 Tax=Seonamhaeicola sp. TaxID=1912245 RepID=UPI00260F7386|nr:hypothetical protein [Seonamhaeicola sp.]